MVHTLRLDNYSPTPRKLVLGTNSSFGTESIKIERGAGWDGLNLTATWHIPGREEPLRVALLDGDAMDVPPEVTKEAKDGVLVLAGLASGVQRASCNVDYLILEQAGVYGGADAEPTPELAAQVLEAALQAKADAEAAAEEAAAAKARAEEAQAASAAAKEAAEAAAADAAKAGPYAEAALAAQEAAENAAAAAAASKSAADTLAAEAARAALAAENSKAAANNAAYFAGENATAAQKAAATATAAANDAGQSASDAGQSASDAAASKAAAETAAKAAQDAQTATAAAKAEAVKAQGTAQTAAKSAQDAQAAAEKVRDDAKTAQKGAEAARDVAAKSAEAAAKSEANVKQSADTLAESVKNITPDDSSIGDKPWSSKHIIDMLCPPLEESGNPVVCYPVAGYPLGVKASWEPVQEGSGEPYPAGGGKNLWGNLLDKVFVGITGNLNTISTAKSTAKIACTEKDVYTLSNSNRFAVSPSNVGVIAYFDNSDNMLAREAVTNNNVLTLIAPAGTAYVRASCYAPTDDDKIQFEKGATATAYAPYENIRPINGRNSVTVNLASGVKAWKLLTLDGTEDWTVFGKFLEDKSDWYYTTGRIQGAINAAPTKGNEVCSHYPHADVANNNTLKGCAIVWKCIRVRWGDTIPDNADDWKAYLAAQYAAGTPVQVAYKLSAAPIVPEDGAIYFAEQPAQSGSGDPSPTNIRPILLDGAVKDGGTSVLTLPETIYGGSVDAVSGSGERARRMLPLDGTENWFTWGVNANNAAVTGFFTYDIADYKVEDDKGICSHLPHSSGGTWGGRNEGIGFASVGSSRYLMCCVKTKILDDVSSDANAITSWKAYLAAQYAAGTPVQVCYELATPVPFTATGGAALPALAGVNTVLTDADSVAVTGRADPIKRIEDLEAAVASIN